MTPMQRVLELVTSVAELAGIDRLAALDLLASAAAPKASAAEPTVTVREVAARGGVGISAVHNAIHRGTLAATKDRDTGRHQITEGAAQRWLNSPTRQRRSLDRRRRMAA